MPIRLDLLTVEQREQMRKQYEELRAAQRKMNEEIREKKREDFEKKMRDQYGEDEAQELEDMKKELEAAKDDIKNALANIEKIPPELAAKLQELLTELNKPVEKRKEDYKVILELYQDDQYESWLNDMHPRALFERYAWYKARWRRDEIAIQAAAKLGPHIPYLTFPEATEAQGRGIVDPGQIKDDAFRDWHTRTQEVLNFQEQWPGQKEEYEAADKADNEQMADETSVEFEAAVNALRTDIEQARMYADPVCAMLQHYVYMQFKGHAWPRESAPCKVISVDEKTKSCIVETSRMAGSVLYGIVQNVDYGARVPVVGDTGIVRYAVTAPKDAGALPITPEMWHRPWFKAIGKGIWIYWQFFDYSDEANERWRVFRVSWPPDPTKEEKWPDKHEELVSGTRYVLFGDLEYDRMMVGTIDGSDNQVSPVVLYNYSETNEYDNPDYTARIIHADHGGVVEESKISGPYTPGIMGVVRTNQHGNMVVGFSTENTSYESPPFTITRPGATEEGDTITITAKIAPWDKHRIRISPNGGRSQNMVSEQQILDHTWVKMLGWYPEFETGAIILDPRRDGYTSWISRRQAFLGAWAWTIPGTPPDEKAMWIYARRPTLPPDHIILDPRSTSGEVYDNWANSFLFVGMVYELYTWSSQTGLRKQTLDISPGIDDQGYYVGGGGLGWDGTTLYAYLYANHQKDKPMSEKLHRGTAKWDGKGMPQWRGDWTIIPYVGITAISYDGMSVIASKGGNPPSYVFSIDGGKKWENMPPVPGPTRNNAGYFLIDKQV